MSVFNGKSLRIEIYGASHAEEIGVKVCGLPKGLSVDQTELCAFMHRRSPGFDAVTSARRESDVPIFISGLTNAITNGNILNAVIKNENVNRGDYVNLKHIPRPGHADLCAWQKYGLEHDMSGGGEFSGRMTAALCIVGGILIQELARNGIIISAEAVSSHEGVELRDEAELAKAIGDSAGGIVKCSVKGLPVGLGGELFDGIDAEISRLIFAIPGVKGVEFGSGFEAAKLSGSENNDEYIMRNGKVEYLSNNAGGVLGGITTGEPISFNVAMKPTPSIAKAQKSVDLDSGENVSISVSGRHDPCFALRTPPIVESVAAIAIYDVMLTECRDNDLLSLRSSIDRIDSELIALLDRRLDVCDKIADYKRENSLPVFDAKRECDKLAAIPQKYHALFREIMRLSKAHQEEKLHE